MAAPSVGPPARPPPRPDAAPLRAGNELIRATREFASEKRWLSWWHLVSTLVILAGLLVLACRDGAWWIRIPSSTVAGFVLVRLFIIFHDYQHGTILKGSPIVALIMTIYGLLSLSPPSIWKRSHNHHHGNNAKIYGAQIGSFPVMTTEGHACASRSARFVYAFSRHPITIALGYLTVFLYGMCIRSLVVSPSKHVDSAVAIVLHLVVVVWLAVVAVDILILGLVLPLGIACALGSYIFYAQHNYPGVKLRTRADWDFVFAALWSSSYIKMSPLLHWLTGNIGYHHIHHLNPRIPFYRLPEAMSGIKELQAPVTTSLRPIDIYRCFRLKLWDSSRDEMVTFRGAR